MVGSSEMRFVRTIKFSCYSFCYGFKYRPIPIYVGKYYIKFEVPYIALTHIWDADMSMGSQINKIELMFFIGHDG